MWIFEHPDIQLEWRCYAEDRSRAVEIFKGMWIDKVINRLMDNVQGSFADGSIKESATS